MLKMVDGTGIIGVDMVCPLGVSTPQPPNYDRVELEGTGILVLPNSLDAPLEGLELGGKTEQVTTTGAQLFDKNSVVNGVIIADGSVTDNAPLYVTSDYIPVKPSVMYACTETGSKRLKFFDIDKQPVQKINFEDANVERGGTFTTGETTRFIRLSLLREKLDSIMLNEGSKSIPYEPYTGGKPSPSPEYPQEIKNVGKWNEEKQKYEVDVKVTGKNLLNLQKEPDVKDLHQGWKVGNGESLVLSLKDKGNKADVTGCFLGFTKTGFKSEGAVFILNNGAIQKNPLKASKPYVSVYPANDTITKKITERYEVQCEHGTVATPYQPYKEQTLTLTSDRPITKWDRLVEQGGEIGWLYQSAINEYRGDTVVAIYENGFYFLLNNEKLKSGEGYCEELKQYVSREEKPCINFNASQNTYAYTLNTQAIYGSTASAIKEYLKTHPLHLAYKTETTEFVPLPQSEQNAIRALKTYYPTTVITVDGGELDPDIKVTYRKEI